MTSVTLRTSLYVGVTSLGAILLVFMTACGSIMLTLFLQGVLAAIIRVIATIGEIVIATIAAITSGFTISLTVVLAAVVSAVTFPPTHIEARLIISVTVATTSISVSALALFLMTSFQLDVELAVAVVTSGAVSVAFAAAWAVGIMSLVERETHHVGLKMTSLHHKSESIAEEMQVYKCRKCSWTGEEAPAATEHFTKEHAFAMDAPYFCKACSYATSYPGRIAKHIKQAKHTRKAAEYEGYPDLIVKRPEITFLTEFQMVTGKRPSSMEPGEGKTKLPRVALKDVFIEPPPLVGPIPDTPPKITSSKILTASKSTSESQAKKKTDCQPIKINIQNKSTATITSDKSSTVSKSAPENSAPLTSKVSSSTPTSTSKVSSSSPTKSQAKSLSLSTKSLSSKSSSTKSPSKCSSLSTKSTPKSSSTKSLPTNPSADNASDRKPTEDKKPTEERKPGVPDINQNIIAESLNLPPILSLDPDIQIDDLFGSSVSSTRSSSPSSCGSRCSQCSLEKEENFKPDYDEELPQDPRKDDLAEVLKAMQNHSDRHEETQRLLLQEMSAMNRNLEELKAMLTQPPRPVFDLIPVEVTPKPLNPPSDPRAPLTPSPKPVPLEPMGSPLSFMSHHISSPVYSSTERPSRHSDHQTHPNRNRSTEPIPPTSPPRRVHYRRDSRDNSHDRRPSREYEHSTRRSDRQSYRDESTRPRYHHH